MSAHVVILGGGYAGSMLARNLDAAAKAGKIRLTLIDRRDSFHHKIGSIRASVQGAQWAERIRIPLNQICEYGKIVVGEVVKVDSNENLIYFADDKNNPPIKYDILVCATGTLNHSPGDLPASITNETDIQKYFDDISKALEEAKDIVIVGGGASAVEYAGEIRHRFPDKKIRIICSNSNLLSSSIAPLSKKFLKRLYAKLKELDIELIREEKVVRPTELEFGSRKFEQNLTIHTIGKQNLTIQTDLLLWAASWQVESHVYPDDWLNELGELNVRDTFQVLNQANIFSIGDASSTAETKQAITLPSKMKYITPNVLKVAEAINSQSFDNETPIKGLKHYKLSEKATMYLPVGPYTGISQLNGWIFGDARTSQWKGKDLYTSLFWSELTGKKAPTAPKI